MLNVLLVVFMQAFYATTVDTKEATVDGVWQAELLSGLCDEAEARTLFATSSNAVSASQAAAPSVLKEFYVVGICTDNASVMRRTWRLMRSMRGVRMFWTYGCAMHAFSLLLKDLFKLELFAECLKISNKIVVWFSKHLQNTGLATLRRHQQAADIVHKCALVKPAATRCGSNVR
jgi:hypothetical protein